MQRTREGMSLVIRLERPANLGPSGLHPKKGRPRYDGLGKRDFIVALGTLFTTQ
jgi:hypothetical protein